MPRVKAHDRISARGNIKLHQEVDTSATSGHACWKLRACGPRVLGQGHAKNS
jgi:hypothetical protein